MHCLARIMTIVLLAVFVAGSLAHVANATGMMAAGLADAGPMSAADCEGCGPGDSDDESAATCAVVCIAPFAAVPSDATATAPLDRSHAAPGSDRVRGAPGSAAFHPPRTLAQS